VDVMTEKSLPLSGIEPEAGHFTDQVILAHLYWAGASDSPEFLRCSASLHSDTPSALTHNIDIPVMARYNHVSPGSGHAQLDWLSQRNQSHEAELFLKSC